MERLLCYDSPMIAFKPTWQVWYACKASSSLYSLTVWRYNSCYSLYFVFYITTVLTDTNFPACCQPRAGSGGRGEGEGRWVVTRVHQVKQRGGSLLAVQACANQDYWLVCCQQILHSILRPSTDRNLT